MTTAANWVKRDGGNSRAGSGRAVERPASSTVDIASSVPPSNRPDPSVMTVHGMSVVRGGRGNAAARRRPELTQAWGVSTQLIARASLAALKPATEKLLPIHGAPKLDFDAEVTQVISEASRLQAAARIAASRAAQAVAAAAVVSPAVQPAAAVGRVPGPAAGRAPAVAPKPLAVQQEHRAQPAPTPRPQASPAAPASTAAPMVASKRVLFRDAAMKAQNAVDEADVELPKPSGGAWGLLAVVASLVIVLFGGAAVAAIEVTVKAPGVLRAPEGLRSIEAALAGSVSEVLVRAGEYVEEGELVARLEGAQLQASLVSRKKELSLLQQEGAESATTDERLGKRTRSALYRRRDVLKSRAEINRVQREQRHVRLVQTHAMVVEGAASKEQELVARESYQGALQQQQELRSGLADVQLQLAELSNRLESQALARRTAQSRGQAALEEIQSLLKNTEVRAVTTGRVESILVQVGSVVQPGKVLAQVVPSGALRSIVAFLPSREIAFVAVGTTARVEVESLPVGEFGMGKAVITRISSDIAKPEEIGAAFGEALPGSFVRVELELVEQEGSAINGHLRSGERIVVRLHRRERRILSLMFEFARKWLGQ